LEKEKGVWVEKLPIVLWAYSTTSQVSIGETPFNLIYGNKALTHFEVNIQSPQVLAFDEHRNLE